MTLRILTVIETLGVGGAERGLVDLLPVLAGRGHACEVAVLHGPLDLRTELSAKGLTTHDLGLRHRWDMERGIRRLSRLSRRFDVVHAHLFFAGVYVGLGPNRRVRPRRVVTFHNLGYTTFPVNSPWRRARRAIDRRAMLRMDVRIAVSSAVARHYERNLRLPAISVVHNAVPLPDAVDSCTRAAVEKRFQPTARPTIMAAGRLIAEKGHADLLHAASLLVAAGMDVAVVIAGEGPRRHELNQLVGELGLSTRVSMPGVLDRATLNALTQASSVFVQPSTHEGFPLAPAEAMAAGRPVVASDVGGIPELIEDGVTGLLVPPRDPTTLASALGRVLADRGLARSLGHAARARICDRFSLDHQADQLLTLYQSAP